MGRQALHGDTLKIEQKDDIVDPQKHKDEGEVVIVDPDLADRDYLDALAFAEEPVTIVLNPSAEKNAATAYPVWVNGKGAEVFQNGRWEEIGYLPIGRQLIIKRKVLEIIIRAKLDRVETQHDDANAERPNNTIRRMTTSVHSFSIMEDKNPRGRAWATEMMRRNM